VPSTVPLRDVPAPGELMSVTTLAPVHAGRTVVEVVGRVDTGTAPVLELCLCSQSARRGLRVLVVDLAEVSFLGAAGAAVLTRARRRCERRGVRLVLRCDGVSGPGAPLQLTAPAGIAPGGRPGSVPATRPRCTRGRSAR